MRSRALRLFLALLAIGLFAAGCGDDSTSTTVGDSTPQASGPDATIPDA
ncbi:MAG: hypothetical protein R2695_14815 [Acidimicrobiales bacterium]